MGRVLAGARGEVVLGRKQEQFGEDLRATQGGNTAGRG